VDNCCDTDRSLGIRPGEQLHDGRVHPHFACDRNYSGADKDHSRAKDSLTDG
jgi:hypothetical protein